MKLYPNFTRHHLITHTNYYSCYDDKYTKPVQIYRGEAPIKNFMKQMLKEAPYCQKIIANQIQEAIEDER